MSTCTIDNKADTTLVTSTVSGTTAAAASTSNPVTAPETLVIDRSADPPTTACSGDLYPESA